MPGVPHPAKGEGEKPCVSGIEGCRLIVVGSVVWQLAFRLMEALRLTWVEKMLELERLFELLFGDGRVAGKDRPHNCCPPEQMADLRHNLLRFRRLHTRGICSLAWAVGGFPSQKRWAGRNQQGPGRHHLDLPVCMRAVKTGGWLMLAWSKLPAAYPFATPFARNLLERGQDILPTIQELLGQSGCLSTYPMDLTHACAERGPPGREQSPQFYW